MEECYFLNTPPWVFFTFFKLNRYYQIAQNIILGLCIYSFLQIFTDTKKNKDEAALILMGTDGKLYQQFVDQPKT